MTARMNFERDGTEWPNRAASRLVEAAGINWHVQILGRGPALLLVHGTGASTHSWASAARLLAEDFTVIVPDLPGHAFTSEPRGADYSLPGMARGLAQLLRTLGYEPAIAAGHSAGAAIIVRMCLDKLINPQAVISFNGALFPFRGLAGQIFSPLAKLLALNPYTAHLFAWRAGHRGAVETLILGTGSKIDPESVRIYARLFQCPAHVAATLSMMAQWDLDSLVRDMKQMQVPALLVAADRDRAVMPQMAHSAERLMAHARVLTMAGAGHLAHEERPAESVRIIADLARDRGVLAI